jgi:DNA-binding transcriptional regulator YbjK
MASERRDLIADAAITALAAGGMRGFTHRAVDRAAGLPEGSTSYYFRTRESLIFAVLARMAELDTADIGNLPALGGVVGLEELSDLVAALIQRWLGAGRDRTLARYELTLESTRRPELRAKMAEYGSRFLEMAEGMLTAAGVAEPRRRGKALVVFLDGLVHHQVAGPGPGRMDEADLREACRDMLATALRST